jgi:hypothetical protein
MQITASEPGSEYHLFTKDPSDTACLFVNRLDLVRYCKTVLGVDAPRIAEVGVFKGNFSDILLDVFRPAKLFLLDTFCISDYIAREFTAENHFEYVQKKYADNPAVTLMQGLSHDTLGVFSDHSLDYIYIDADHTYEGVKKDIEVAYRKIKNGGILQFNDYTNYSLCDHMEFGVLYAVNEFLESHPDVVIIGLSLDRSGFHDLAVKVWKPLLE